HGAWAYTKAHADGAALASDSIIDVLLVFLAFAEPSMYFGARAIMDLHQREKRDEERQDLADATARSVQMQQAALRPQALRAAGPAAAVALAVAPMNAVAELSRELPLDPTSHSAPADPNALSHTAHGWRGPRDQAKWKAFVEAMEAGM